MSQEATYTVYTLEEKLDGISYYINTHINDTVGTLGLGGWYVPLPFNMTAHMLMALIALAILCYLFVFKYNKHAPVPTGISNLLEVAVKWVRDEIAIANLGEKEGKKLTPLFCTFFFMILTLNWMGLIPVFVTATSNLSVTAALAFVTFAVMIGGALIKNGPKGLLEAFVPHGVPFPILIILVPIEILGVFIKSTVLAIRLFANLLAGHIILFAVFGLVVAFGLFGLPALGLGLFVFFLEVLVGFIQAYVFTMLSAIFIGQVHHPAH